MRLISCTAGALLSLACLLSGCADEQPTTYRVPKEERPDLAAMMRGEAANPSTKPVTSQTTDNVQPAMTADAMPGLAQQTAAFDAPEWTAPADWQPQDLGSMRKGSWMVNAASGSAEISVLAFPGDVGGDLANVNRWAGQVNLGPLTQPQLDAERQKHPVTTASGQTGFYVHLDGPGGQSIAGVIIPLGQARWFFKMMGDTTVVQAQTPAFLDFVRSTHFPAS